MTIYIINSYRQIVIANICRFFILFALLAISSPSSSSQTEVSKPDSIWIESVSPDNSSQLCSEPGVCELCFAFCSNNGYAIYCCDGGFCCCYETEGDCNRVAQCPSNDC